LIDGTAMSPALGATAKLAQRLFVIFFSDHLAITIFDEDWFPDRDFSTRTKIAGADRTHC
jgi:hypothetical protein